MLPYKNKNGIAVIGGPIKVVLTLDGNNYSVGIDRAGQQMQEFQAKVKNGTKAVKDFESGLNSTTAKIKDLVFAISIARFAFADFNDIVLALPVAFVKAGGEMQRMLALMEGLSTQTTELGRKAEALRNTQFIFNIASNTPFELKTLTDMFVKLKTAGIDPTDGSMRALTNSLAKFGATDEQAKRASIAIQQMAGKGVISMEELRQQLGEAIPNAMQLMARGMGMSMAELTKAVSTGTVVAGSALRKMLLEMQIDAAGSAERMMQTLPGQISALKTEWEKFKITASQGGLEDVVKEQIAALSKFFASTEGQEFARQLGKAFRDVALGLVNVKDAIVELWPIISLVGKGLLLYFGGSVLQSAFGNLTSKIRLARDEWKAYQVAQEAAAQKAQQEIQQKLETDRQLATGQREGLSTRINLLQQELSAVRAKEAEERALIRKRQELFRDYKATLEQAGISDNKAFAAAYSGKTGQYTAEIQKMADLGAAQREAIANTSQQINVMRTERAERERAIQTEIRQLEVRKAYSQTAIDNVNATVASINATREANQQKAVQAGLLGRVSAGARGAASVIGNFGRGLLAMTGWSIAATAALAAVEWAYNKLAKAANSASLEMDRNRRLKDEQSTKTDLEDRQAKVKQIEQELKQAQLELTGGARGSGATGWRAEELQAKIDQLKVNLAVAQDAYKETKRVVDQLASQSAGEQLGQRLREQAERATRASDIWNKLTETNIELDKISKETEKARWEKLNKEAVDLRRAMLNEQMRQTVAVFENAREEAEKAGPQALNEWKKQYADALRSIRENLRTVDAPPDRLGGKPNVGNLAATERESAILKMVQDQKAALNKARLEYDSLLAEARDMKELAEKEELSKLIAKLASGDFDINPTKDNQKGISPGGPKRTELQERFAKEGKSAREFLATIEGLNVKMRDSEKTVAQYFSELLEGAGALTEAERATKALADIQQRQAGLTKELADSQAEYDAGLTFIPTRVTSLARELEQLAKKASLTGKALFDLQAAQRGALGTLIMSELNRDAVQARRSLEESRINSIFNIQEREEAAHKQTMARIQAEYEARKREIENNVDDATQRQIAISRLEEVIGNKRQIEMTRFTLASMTDLQRLSREWADFNGNVDRAIANSAREWTDQLFNFVTGTERNFSQLVENTIREFAKIQFQKMLGPSMETLFSQLGGFLKTAGSAVAKSAGGLFTKGGNSDQMTTLDSLAGSAYSVTESFDMLKEQGIMSSLSAYLAEQVVTEQSTGAEMTATVATATFATALEGAVPSIYNFVAAMNSGSSKSYADLAGAAIQGFAGFANGGIMTSMGPLPLRKYATGGIARAREPQVAIFGEGSMNEAYVPLPDGNRIPVEMRGSAPPAASVAMPNVQVNVINQSGTPVSATQKGQPRMDMRQMVLDVVLDAAQRPGPFRDGLAMRK